jgi:hypothetical protein
MEPELSSQPPPDKATPWSVRPVRLLD